MGDLEERLKVLRQQYAASLPAAVASAREAFDRIEADGAEAIEAVWQVVHRVYGTAGSYGLDPVAASARQLEEALTPYRKQDALPAAVAESAREALEALEAQSALAART